MGTQKIKNKLHIPIIDGEVVEESAVVKQRTRHDQCPPPPSKNEWDECVRKSKQSRFEPTPLEIAMSNSSKGYVDWQIEQMSATQKMDIDIEYRQHIRRSFISRMLIVPAFISFFIGAYLSLFENPASIYFIAAFFVMLILAWAIGK